MTVSVRPASVFKRGSDARREGTAGLRAKAAAAYAGYQATHYDDTERVLSALIRETEAAAGGDDREACSVRALVYDNASKRPRWLPLKVVAAPWRR
jgi:hypothetical protein